ncbi:MAG: S41 family peptidase [Bacteroidota bacterium]
MKTFKALILFITAIHFCYAQEKSEGLPKLSTVEKVYGLSKIWSEVRYNFVGIEDLPFDLDSLYSKTIEDVINAEDVFQYYNVLSRFCAQMNDGHTYITYPSHIRKTKLTYPPLRTDFVEEKVVITKVYNDSLRKIGITEGLEVLEINGIDVMMYGKKKIEPYASASTKQGLIERIYHFNLLKGDIDEVIELTFRDIKGNTFRHKISRRLPEKKPQKKAVEFHLINDDIGLLTVNKFSSDDFWHKFDSIYSDILETDALIIDVRSNLGGNSQQGYYILRHLTTSSIQTTKWITRESTSIYNVYGLNSFWQMKSPDIIPPIDNKQLYDKPIAVLINANTLSAAEDFCAVFDYMDRGILIGSKTGGTTGQPMFIELPGGGKAKICIRKDMYPDGTEYVGKGVIPDIEIQKTIESVLNKEDLVLKKAASILVSETIE